MKLTELKDVKVIAFVNNTTDGPDYKRAVIVNITLYEFLVRKIQQRRQPYSAAITR